MTTRTRIYLAAAAFVALLFLISSLTSRIEIARMEKQISKAKEAAQTAENVAEASELKAAEYKEKIAYLENDLAEIRTIATKQNEELQKITADTSNARGRMLDARSVRSVAISAAELCEKLRSVGHGCE